MKKIVLLGSTGSIGLSTIKVVEDLPEEFSIVGIAVNSDYVTALEQAKKFRIGHVAVADAQMAIKCRDAAPAGVMIHSGMDGVEEVAALDAADIVLCAVVGIAGLKPVLAAVNKGTDVALATKEVLVAGGSIVTEACRRTGASLIPVDSEHSAILQCLSGMTGDVCYGVHNSELMGKVRRLILTASGGPFFSKPEINFDEVTVKQALLHPNWSMGPKVTIDSATMMNKGLEVIEAHWMFNFPVEKINVMIHPESIIHSMLEFVDGSTMAQMSVPDMRYAIQYALTYPDHLASSLPGLDLTIMKQLRFDVVDTARFPALRLAMEAGITGGTMPVVMNAANEVAVKMFLEGSIPFSGIWKMVEVVMKNHILTKNPVLDDILAADLWAREESIKWGKN